MTLKELRNLKEGEDIHFKGVKFYSIGWENKGEFPFLSTGMPLCTKEQYENFIIPFAHIYPNGTIMRFGIKIGDIKDLKRK